MSGEGEGFLSRWSRRKREAAEASDLPDAPPGPPAEALPAPIVEPPPDPAPLDDALQSAPEPAEPRPAACRIPNLPEIDLASLPRIEDLTAQSDFSLFLRPGIPQVLRNAALRRMWSLDPTIRDYIGPVEYQWDFNAPGGLPLGFSNELGGDVGRLLAQAIGKLEEFAPPDVAIPDAGPPSEADDAAETGAPDAAEASADPLDEAAAVLPIESVAPPPAAPEPPDRPVSLRRRHGGALPA